MTKITVLLPIVVPDGGYCWHIPSQTICKYFSNELGHPVCDLDLGNLEYTAEEFVHKGSICSKLQRLPLPTCKHGYSGICPTCDASQVIMQHSVEG